MSKQPITWIELIKKHMDDKKKETNKKVGLGDVVDDAKKEWADIKNGTHEKYIKGSSKGTTRKSKKSKKSKSNDDGNDSVTSRRSKSISKTRRKSTDSNETNCDCDNLQQQINALRQELNELKKKIE